MSWSSLESAMPELAEFGAERFTRFSVAYLATVGKDGSPRVHPVTPIVGQGHLFLFMEPTSPKGHDLRRDGRYALHSDSSGESGEFSIAGRGNFVDDPTKRALAAQLATYAPAERYLLFELEGERAASTRYVNGHPVRQRWTVNP